METLEHRTVRPDPRHRRIRYTAKPAGFLTRPVDVVQLNRRANLRDVLAELEWLGTCSTEEQVAILCIGSRHVITGFLQGDDIPDTTAREIEWAMQKRNGWMDGDHRHEPLED